MDPGMSVRHTKNTAHSAPRYCSLLSSFARCAPPGLRDPHPRYHDRARTHRHALGVCCREPGVDQLEHLLNPEATRKHDRSEQPSGLEASSSSARQRSGLGPRLRRSVGCLGYAGRNVDTAYSHRLSGAFSPSRPLPSRTCLACGGERGKRTVVLAFGPSIRRPIPGAW